MKPNLGALLNSATAKRQFISVRESVVYREGFKDGFKEGLHQALLKVLDEKMQANQLLHYQGKAYCESIIDGFKKVFEN